MENINPSFKEETKKEESLTPSELVKKHIQDPDDVITDAKLKEVKVGKDAEDKKEINKEADAKKDSLENLSGNDSLPNPYSILGS